MLLLELDCIPFALDFSLGCGQVFRWRRERGSWIGIVQGHVLKTRLLGNGLEVKATPDDINNNLVRSYFRLDDDLSEILEEIGRDDFIRNCVQALFGLRLIRQEAWECLASYICATFNNIPRICGIVDRLCRSFGDEIDGYSSLHNFPSAEVLSRRTCKELQNCGLGYRAPYLLGSASAVAEGHVDFDRLKRMPYQDAKFELMKLPGVGDKVADCVCLFALDKLEAFPVDVWVRRIITSNYAEHFVNGFKFSSLSPRRYREINAFGRKYFGRYSGYAQQYLYTRYARALSTSQIQL